MSGKLTLSQVQDLLRRACAAAGGVSVWARNNGVSQPYVSLVLNGRTKPGVLILMPLGIEREVVYRTLSAEDAHGRRGDAC